MEKKELEAYYCLPANVKFCKKCVFFFFSSRRRHTSFSRDWSSDVCSSDLFIWDINQFHDGAYLRHPSISCDYQTQDQGAVGFSGCITSFHLPRVMVISHSVLPVLLLSVKRQQFPQSSLR